MTTTNKAASELKVGQRIYINRSQQWCPIVSTRYVSNSNCYMVMVNEGLYASDGTPMMSPFVMDADLIVEVAA